MEFSNNVGLIIFPESNAAERLAYYVFHAISFSKNTHIHCSKFHY